jgi:molybdopterin biosynthesis enzyme
MAQRGVSGGAIELYAECRGLFRVAVARLNALNAIDSIAIATRHSFSPVEKGDTLAALRIVSPVIREKRLAQAAVVAGKEPLFELLPYTARTACLVTTGSEIVKGRIKDNLTPVVTAKLAAYGIGVTKEFLAGDVTKDIAAAIAKARAVKPDIILCTGGMSVDPDDNTPGAIALSGARIVTYGAPVLPGSMFLLAYFPDGTAILGLPSCVMYDDRATIFDIVLPRVAAGVPLTKQDFTALGNGGMCLSCPECRFPLCPFGK